jgi:hypothetical protein
MYNILNVDGGEETNNKSTVTLPTVAAAMATAGGTMMGSTYAAVNAAAITAKVTAAINQLSANQMHIMQVMVAMNFASPPPDITAPAYNLPPIQSVRIPNQQTFPRRRIPPRRGCRKRRRLPPWRRMWQMERTQQ